jgi:hypothetical protein
MRGWFVGLVILLLILAGCSQGSRTVDDQPDLVGQIQEIQAARLLVRGPAPADGANPRLVWVTITAKTRILEPGTPTKTLTADELKVGDQVTLWFTGPVKESYPEQATARQIWVQR